MKMFRKLLKTLLAATAAAAVIMPSPLLACAACTGKTDEALAVGMNWGIVTLLGFVVSVLSCLGVFFVHVARRTAADDNEATPTKPGE